jgi:hypothetical protein
MLAVFVTPMDVMCERSQSTRTMPVQQWKHAAGITVMEAGHPFIDGSKMHKVKQPSPVSSQPKPSMLCRSLQYAKAHAPIRLTPSNPCREAMPDP